MIVEFLAFFTKLCWFDHFRSNKDDYWVAHVPSLSGCHSQGKKREEAINNIKEAIELYNETCIAYGDPIPTPSKEIKLYKVSIDVSATRQTIFQ